MRKEIQRTVNKEAEAIFETAVDEYNDQCRFDDCVRLLSCQAWVYETTNFFLLKSYGTIVAVIDKASDTVVDVLRMVYGYTATSAQHISKFSRATCYGGYGAGKWGCEHRITWYPVD